MASSQAGDTVKYSSVAAILIVVGTAGLQAIEKLVWGSCFLCSTRWLRSVNRLKACFISVVLSLDREGGGEVLDHPSIQLLMWV